MKSRRIVSLCLLVSAIALGGCGGGDPSPGQQDTTFALDFDGLPTVAQGASTVTPVQVVDGFSLTNPDPGEDAPFTSPVDLRLVRPLPPGVDGDFSPTPLRPGTSGTLTLRATADAQAGHYRLIPAGTISGGSTTRFFRLQATVIGNCAPGTADVLTVAPSRFGRTVALGRGGGVFVWGDNTLQDDSDAPGVLAFYTAQRVASLPAAVSAASSSAGTVIVPADRGPLLMLAHYWLSGIGAPTGNPGWVIETIRRSDGSTIEGFRHVVFVETVDGVTTFMALHVDGSVWKLALPTGQIERVEGASNIVDLAAGAGFVLAVRADRTVLAWGRNDFGQLGDGTRAPQTAPVQVPGLTDITHVAAGGSHALARRANGTVLAWGRGGEGQLGNGLPNDSNTPVQVMTRNNAPIATIVALAAGSQHSLALAEDGSVWSWGNNDSGQLGTGAEPSRPFAATIENLTVESISAGGNRSFGTHVGGRRVSAWGDNRDGRLGDGTSETRTAPVYALGLGRGENLDCRAAPPSDDVVFADTEFATDNWHVLDLPAVPGGPMQSVIQVTTGGNPGAFRRATHSMPAGSSSLQVVHMNVMAQYSPFTHGPIAALDYREDRRLFAEDSQHIVSSQLALEQSGRVFRAAFAGLPDVTGLQWTTASASGILPQNFVQISGPPCDVGVACPDFNSTGGTITFGYVRSTANVVNGASFDLVHGIDNWRVTVKRR
jgi:hypothetical protein